MLRPVALLRAFEAEVLTGSKGDVFWVLSQQRALHRLHHQGFGPPGTGLIMYLDSTVTPELYQRIVGRSDGLAIHIFWPRGLHTARSRIRMDLSVAMAGRGMRLCYVRPLSV